MQPVTYTAFRRELKSYLRKTRDDADTLLVTNNDPTENVVVINQRDWESIEETLRIYENKPLHDKVLRGAAEARAGRVEHHDLIEEADGDTDA